MKKSMLVISLVLWGCAGNPLHKEQTKTMEQAVAEMNAKREKCESDGVIGSGTNGYDSWSAECTNGIMTYKDTTKESQEYQNKEQARKSELINAARSRILSAEETESLLAWGPLIFTAPMQPFYQKDIDERFDELLLQQARLKAAHGDSEGRSVR